MKKNKSKLLASIVSITLSLGAIALPNIPAEAYTGKVTLVGDVDSGKNELIRALSERDPELESSLWDTAGQESYLSLLQTSLRNANVVIITIDLNRPNDMLDSINRWAARVNSNVEIIVVGTNSNDNHNDYILLESAVNSSIVPNAKRLVTSAISSYGIDLLRTFIVPKISQDQDHVQEQEQQSEQSHRLTLFERIRNFFIR